MKNLRILLLIVVIFLAFACKKEENGQTQSPTYTNAAVNTRLNVTVKHIYNMSTLEDSLLPNATVLLKVNASDMDFIKTGTTNDQGLVKFSYIDTPTVWIEASHPMIGSKTERATLTKGNPNQRVISIF